MDTIDKLHQSKAVLAACVAVELAILYGLVSWAIDSGRLLVYALCIVMIGLILADVVRFFKLLKPAPVKVTSGRR